MFGEKAVKIPDDIRQKLLSRTAKRRPNLKNRGETIFILLKLSIILLLQFLQHMTSQLVLPEQLAMFVSAPLFCSSMTLQSVHCPCLSGTTLKPAGLCNSGGSAVWWVFILCSSLGFVMVRGPVFPEEHFWTLVPCAQIFLYGPLILYCHTSKSILKLMVIIWEIFADWNLDCYG